MASLKTVTITLGVISTFCTIASAAPILDASQELDNGWPGGYPTTAAWHSQTLTPTNEYLSSIEVFVRPGNYTPSPWNLIMDVYGQSADNGLSLSTLLGSKTVSINTAASIFEWYAFDFDEVDISSYTADAGTGRLLVVLKSDTNYGSGTISRAIAGSATTSTPNPYDGGIWRYTLNSGGTWTVTGGSAVNAVGGGDMAFRLYTTAAVPEPIALAPAALVGAFLMRRRSR